jgi:hypothetical protein
VDNFPSFTELGHLPDWYEAVNSRRARQLGMQDEMEQKPRKTAGSLGVSGLKLSCFLARAAGSMERIRRKLGKTKGSLGSLRSGRRAPSSGTYPQVIPRIFYVRGVWEFETMDLKSRSTSLPSYNPGTSNTFFSPSSLVLHP